MKFKDYMMVCCYLSPNMEIQNYKIKVDAIVGDTYKKEAIIIGDYNAKSLKWRSPITDARGELWAEIIEKRNMVVHNTGQKPTFVRGNTRCYIDVTISTNKVARKITPNISISILK